MINDPWSVNENNFPVQGKMKDKLKFLINYAVLAPNSHNTQPWKFKVNDDNIEIMPNYDRSLAYSDRAHRELFLSLGCAIANILIAGNHFGYVGSVVYLPEDTVSEVAARITFIKGKVNPKLDSLFSSIVIRRTNRAPYKENKIDEDIVKNAIEFIDDDQVNVKFVTDKNLRKKISDLKYQAHLYAYSDKYFKEELSQWVRSIYTTKKDGMPLFNVGVPGPLSVFAKYLIRLVPPKMQSSRDRKLVSTSPLHLIVSAKYDTKEYWLRTGKIVEYIFLVFAKNNVSVAPMAGILEYEVTKNKLSKLLNIKDNPLFFARVGLAAKSTPPAPRMKAEDVIIE